MNTEYPTSDLQLKDPFLIKRHAFLGFLIYEISLRKSPELEKFHTPNPWDQSAHLHWRKFSEIFPNSGLWG